MLDGRPTPEGARTVRWAWSVVGLAAVSVLFRAASYGWIIGLAPPTRWISASASPWWSVVCC